MSWLGRLRSRRRADAASGFLTRLARHRAGNTLAIMAAALMPVTVFAGSAVDMGRLYAVKVRLQQACDAGVLAGRKFLTSGLTTGQPLTGNAFTQANNYFTNNLVTSWLNSGWYVANSQTFTPVTVADAQGNIQVGGTATVQVPMTLMKVFGMATQTLTVTCQASFSTPDTDVMFVLDTTGSMGCAVTRAEPACGPWAGQNEASSTSNGVTSYYIKEETDGSGNNVSRIDSLRQAVIAFYNTVSTTKDSSTNVRYGFVPYTSTVNVGKLLYNLSPSYLVSKWPYQSRLATGDYVIKTNSSKTVAAADQNACNAYYTRTPANRYDANTGDANPGYPNSGTATANDPVWTPASGSGSSYKAASCTVNTDQVGPVWTYQPAVSYDVSNYVKGNSMTDPSRVDGSTTVWNGCIEERDTTATNSFSQSSLPADLDPDLVPSSDATRWRPMWTDVAYQRYYFGYGGGLHYVNGSLASSNWGTFSLANNSPYTIYNFNDPTLAAAGNASCPAQALPLFLPADKISGLSTITNYVNGLKALGGTYHDIGMIWGTRMLSPTGIWSSNNAWPSGRAQPKRVMVFVTDGTMSPSSQLYGAYATEYPDRRVTGTTFASTSDPNAGRNADGTCTDTSQNCYSYTDFHNQRFLAECAKAKSSPLNYDVWVVEVAQASSTQLTQCASRPSQVLVGQTPAQLKTAFQQIAAQVAMLRVSK